MAAKGLTLDSKGYPGAVFELRCEVQKYLWGKLGLNSAVAKLSKCADPNFNVVDSETYAELWMGTHPKAPSLIKCLDNASLLHYVEANPHILGTKVLKQFGGELPYLFKVLSVNKSLSIQAHPNKAHAEQLNAERPDIYKDSNHKPEMAIALSPFEGLCGFRPLKEIQGFLEKVPEFHTVVGEMAAGSLMKCTSNSPDVSIALRSCFENVMTCKPEVRKENLSSLLCRLMQMNKESKEFVENQGELLIRLNSQFPGDVGCFVIYFLNHIKLLPGEAMFLGANEPHAYLDGNCIECMACSDNVVRAGLTPKLIDVPTLCGMLNYAPATAKSKLFLAVQADSDPYLKIYNPPVDDFAVQHITIPKDVTKYTLSTSDCASILLIIEGNGNSCGLSPKDIEIKPGVVLFLNADASLDLSLSGNGFIAFRALCIL